MNLSGFQRFVQCKRRQNSRDSFGKHGFAGSGRAREDEDASGGLEHALDIAKPRSLANVRHRAFAVADQVPEVEVGLTRESKIVAAMTPNHEAAYGRRTSIDHGGHARRAR